MSFVKGRSARLLLVAAAVCAIGAVVAKSAPQGAPQGSRPGQPVTFNRDIAPIIFHSCSTCHRPGEAAPFSLLAYSDVKRHARQIVEVTRSRAMPPWLPEPQKLKFTDELRLSEAEIDLLARWVEQGAVEGDASDLPPQPKFVEGWRLGKPDLILTATKPLTLPPQGTDTYWNFIFPVPIQETKWVKAVEIRPGDSPCTYGRTMREPRVALAQMGRNAEAKTHLERALQLDPGQPVAKENLEALKRETSAH